MPEIDIIRGIKERETKILKLQEEIDTLRKVAEMYGLNENLGDSFIEEEPSPNKHVDPLTIPENTSHIQKPKFGASKFHKSIGDAVAEMLEDEQNGLHLDEILRRLQEDKITPTKNSLDAALRKDSKTRFKLVGVRTYGLAK